MEKRELKVGEVEGNTIYYNPGTKKFTVTVETKGVKQTFRSSSEISLRKQVEKALEKPPTKAIEVHWYGISRPEIAWVTTSGNRLYRIGSTGKKRRVDPSNFRRFNEEAFKKLQEIWEKYNLLKDEFDHTRNRLEKVV